MAEGFARAYSRGMVEVHSAGLMAAGINRKAIAVMKEIGIDISQQKSKELDESLLQQMDVVITLCGHAEACCPRTPSETVRLHWPIRDPVGTIGSEETIMIDFRRARDEIGSKVGSFMEEFLSQA